VRTKMKIDAKPAARKFVKPAKLADEVREYERGLRDYATRERAKQRRLDKIPPEGEPFIPSAAQQRRLDRSAQRDARRVRRLAERALRAMDANRWDDVLSDLIDGAAILSNGGCLIPSRAGYEVIAAEELGYILAFAEEHAERGCRPRWGDLPEDRAERRARRAA
jgi:hypothetical protein